MQERKLFSWKCSLCAKCKIPFHGNDVFKWSICQHTHCKKCLNATFNTSLLMSNSLPKCEYPNCNQQLKLKDAISFPISLLMTYKSSIQSIQQFKREQCLIFGSIRNIASPLQNCNRNIPQDIIKLIHDYYNLRLYSIFPCNSCLCIGYQWKKEKKIIRKCTDCIGGWRRIDCNECKGAGYKSEFQINTGSGYEDCFRVKCSKCSGCGKSSFTERCTTAECESGFVYGLIMNKKECNECKGQKYVMKLDFIKLCNKQILCFKCRNYNPMDSIMYWSKCSHSYCMSCFEIYVLPLVKKQLYNKNIIPMCPETDCDETFAENNIQIIEGLHNSYELTVSKLRKLYGVKDKFKCKCCRKYHPMDQLQKCGNCESNYASSCDKVINWKDCTHLCCFRCASGRVNNCLGKQCKSTNTDYKVTFICEMCRKVTQNGLFLWSICKHTYCMKCVKNYFGKSRNSVIMEGNSIFYKRKKHLRHIEVLAAPVCFQRNCNQLLCIDDYKSIRN
eukprot:287353_1